MDKLKAVVPDSETVIRERTILAIAGALLAGFGGFVYCTRIVRSGSP